MATGFRVMCEFVASGLSRLTQNGNHKTHASAYHHYLRLLKVGKTNLDSVNKGPRIVDNFGKNPARIVENVGPAGKCG